MFSEIFSEKASSNFRQESNKIFLLIYYFNMTILSDLALILNLVFLSLERSYQDPQ